MRRQTKGQKKGRTRHRGPDRGFFIFSIVLAAASGLATGLEAGWLLAPEPVQARVGEPAPVPVRQTGLLPTLEAPMNVLLLATDVDYTVQDGRRVMGLGGRTDTMIVARLDPEADQVRLLSIPRDTRVELAGRGGVKINAANPYGGPQMAAQAAADLLGVQIDRYLLINTVAVQQLVDALGGVQIYVDKPMHYDDWAGGLHIHLSPGWNRLDGKAAHDYLRFRHDEAGDIGRIQRQQKFLEAVASQYMTPANLLKTPALLQVVRDHMRTDLTSEELLRLASWGKDLTPQAVQMAMLPGHDAYVGGGWYWITEPAGTQRMVDHFLVGQPASEARSPHRYRVTIKDGVGDRRALGQLHRAVAGAGYGSVAVSGRMPDLGLGVTEIIAQQADEEGALALAGELGVGRVVVAATGDRESDFTIVMGRDWVERGSRQATAR